MVLGAGGRQEKMNMTRVCCDENIQECNNDDGYATLCCIPIKLHGGVWRGVVCGGVFLCVALSIEARDQCGCHPLLLPILFSAIAFLTKPGTY